MADINYTIGAKDNATKPMQQVESSMDRLSKSTKKLSDVSKESTKKINISFSSLAKGVGVVAALDIAVQGVKAAFGAITGSISAANSAFDTQVEAVKGLETALGLAGEEVANQSAKMQAFASDMQAITGVGDEVTLGLMRQASMLGVNGDQLDEVAKAAIGLAEATGKSLDESLKIATNALQGEFGALGEVIPALREMASEEEKLAAVQALASKGLDAKSASADRLAGMTERANGAIGDMLEKVGALLAPIRMIAATGIKYLAEQIDAALVPAIEWVKAAFESMQPVFDSFRSVIDVIVQVVKASFGAIGSVVSSFIGSFGGSADTFKTIGESITSAAVAVGNGVIAAVTAMEVVYHNFGAVVGYAIDAVLLAYETYRADTEHLFVTTIPAYVSWFADNFFNIIETAFSAVYTVITNHISKITDSLKALWDWIASAGSTDLLGTLGEIAGRSYLDGFTSSIGDMPDIASRALTAREKELQARMGKVGNDLAAEFNEKFEARAIDLGERVAAKVNNDLGLNLTSGKDASTKKADDDVQSLANAMSGKAQDMSTNETRLLVRGRAENAQEKILVMMAGMARDVKAMADKARNESMSDDHPDTLQVTVVR